MSEPLKIAVILGSTREGRSGPTVAAWFVGEASARADMTVDQIDLAELDLPAHYPRQPTASMTAWAARLDPADAFVVVTPEYNHGYPAHLKQAVAGLTAPSPGHRPRPSEVGVSSPPLNGLTLPSSEPPAA